MKQFNLHWFFDTIVLVIAVFVAYLTSKMSPHLFLFYVGTVLSLRWLPLILLAVYVHIRHGKTIATFLRSKFAKQ